MTQTPLQKFSHYLFWISLGVGTLIFIIFLLNKNFALLLIGFIWLLLCTAVNLIVFISLLIQAFIHEAERRQSMACALKMLINIPVASFYIYLSA